MNDDPDRICSLIVVLLAAAAAGLYAIRAALDSDRLDAVDTREQSTGIPKAVQWMALWALSPIVDMLAAAGVTANAITGVSLVLGLGGGVAIALGHFGIAGAAIVMASLGDALDGHVARKSHTVSQSGALFDASVDRYEEFFILAGLAFFFRANALLLGITLFALLGAFMVSYGSAKAEAFHISVPTGSMRRAERAVLLAAGTTFVPFAGALAHRMSLSVWSPWIEVAPIVVALTLIAVGGNISAVRRLRAIAAAVIPPPAPRRRHPHEDAKPVGMQTAAKPAPADAAE
jgi:phosphatidylglycerophosphate synthase